MERLLVKDWRDGLKWATTWIGGIIVAWGSLAVDVQEQILALLHISRESIPTIMGLAVLVGRFWSQRFSDRPDPEVIE